MPSGVYTRTNEHRQKISLGGIGRVFSPETCKKISDSHKGLKKPWAAETGRRAAAKQVGPNHWNWKGGVSRAYKTGYYSIEYKRWRREVFKRDNYTCQQCGDKGYVQPHHILHFSKHKEQRFDINNGVTLCTCCHKLMHSKETRKLPYQN